MLVRQFVLVLLRGAVILEVIGRAPGEPTAVPLRRCQASSAVLSPSAT